MLIPVSEAIKTKTDVAVGSGAVLGYFKAIPWPEIAAFLACLYTVLRIVELLWDRWKKK